MKKCSRCNRNLPADMFHHNYANKDTLDYICKDCRNKVSRSNREKRKHAEPAVKPVRIPRLTKEQKMKQWKELML